MAKGKKSKRTSPATPDVANFASTGATKTTAAAVQRFMDNLVRLENADIDNYCPGSGHDFDQQLANLSPRIRALQQQLEKLEFTKQESISKSSVESNDIFALKKRLGEVRQQLYGTNTSGSKVDPSSSLASLAKTYFGGLLQKRRHHLDDSFLGEGEVYLDCDDDSVQEFEASEGELFDSHNEEDLILQGMVERDGNLLEATRLGLCLFEPHDHYSCDFGPTNNHSNNTVEAEVDAVLNLVADNNVTLEKKLESLREKFTSLAKQDMKWKVKAQRANRLIQEEKMQKRVIEFELDKMIAVKKRLESLCRDLHNENRRIQDQLKTVSPTSNNVNNNGARVALPDPVAEFKLPLVEKDNLLRESNTHLADRIVQLADLFLTREQHFASVIRHRELELMNLSEKCSALSNQLTSQNSQLENQSRRITTLNRSESELKAQVRQYVDKFRQVEETLGKSNDLFGTFRAEMEQMGAKLARLERENGQLNSKCATLSRNIIEMADERTKQNQLIETVRGQKAKLEQLCRTLQAERNAALKDKNSGGEKGSDSNK